MTANISPVSDQVFKILYSSEKIHLPNFFFFSMFWRNFYLESVTVELENIELSYTFEDLIYFRLKWAEILNRFSNQLYNI